MSEGSGMAGYFGCLLYLVVIVASIAGWCTHLYVCFNENHWGFLIAGAIFFPIAIIHGWGIWLGWWK